MTAETRRRLAGAGSFVGAVVLVLIALRVLGGQKDWERFARNAPQGLLSGLVRGSIYALISLGYTMVYGILGMINFAHGEVFMLGSYAGLLAIAGLFTLGIEGNAGGLTILVALGFAMAVAGAFGFTVERLAYRPIRHAPSLSPLISAIGASTFLMNFVMIAQGKDQKQFPLPLREPLVRNLLGEGASLRVSPLDLIALGTTVALMLALHFFVNKTKLGTAMRAVSQDKTMAALVGIDIDRVISVTFVTGSVLAAAGGILVAMNNGVTRFDVGYTAGLMAFTAAVLGGIGNIPGAVLGGIVIGLAEDVTSSYPGGNDWKYVVAFVILNVCLIFLPRGLLGERVGERA